MKKKIIFALAVIAIILAAGGIFAPKLLSRLDKEQVLTASQLEKAIAIDQLSTAEFVYNGVAEKVDADNPENVQCYIAYHANVKVGIQMDAVTFDIDEETKTVHPVLPEITVTIASLDEDAISYIPKNPDITLKEVITLCKEDAVREARESEMLYQTAEENLRAVIEALLSPILNSADYTIVW